ncbi:hypothetical protein BJ508DRAFT_413991 [Ascobolus immersus RN42]|uniref:Uncharacterized protein n=1 Tax=Ascobolus immersus RN42 TaxID=1160509 RepID=A0A3N4ILR7_ASCIM|nr:hypothetical protein BJ508DRAFT_413991 [Ascobolus immersus RN42]
MARHSTILAYLLGFLFIISLPLATATHLLDPPLLPATAELLKVGTGLQNGRHWSEDDDRIMVLSTTQLPLYKVPSDHTINKDYAHKMTEAHGMLVDYEDLSTLPHKPYPYLRCENQINGDVRNMHESLVRMDMLKGKMMVLYIEREVRNCWGMREEDLKVQKNEGGRGLGWLQLEGRGGKEWGSLMQVEGVNKYPDYDDWHNWDYDDYYY